MTDKERHRPLFFSYAKGPISGYTVPDMKTLIKNVLIIPMTEKNLSFQGCILIDGDRLAYVGKERDFEADEVVDGKNHIALPSFVNAHTHLAMVLMRNYKDGLENLQAWLSEIFPIEDKLNGDDVLKASRLGAAELIRSGCTCFADMYFFAEETVRASREAGIRAVVGQTLFGDLADTEKRLSERLPQIREAVGDDDMFRMDLAPHAIYTCTGETYRKAAIVAQEEGCMMHTHLSETEKEVTDCLERTGKTPLKYLKSIGGLPTKGYLAHCVWLTDEEVDLLAKMDFSVVHNPSSNAKLASGTLDVSKLLKAGVNVALGTDGASSNNNLNMLEEMHVAALMAATVNRTPSLVSAYDIISMATINGAKALGLDSRIGTLEVGKEADLMLIDTEKVNMRPLNDPFSAIVYSASEEDIDSLWCRGRRLMENRMLLTLDEEKIIGDVGICWEDIKVR